MIPVSYELIDAVAVLLVDSPPVNAIDKDIRKGLLEGVRRAAADTAAKAVLITCAGRTFMSGADLNELGGTIASPSYYEVLDAIDARAHDAINSLPLTDRLACVMPLRQQSSRIIVSVFVLAVAIMA